MEHKEHQSSPIFPSVRKTCPAKHLVKMLPGIPLSMMEENVKKLIKEEKIQRFLSDKG